MSAEELADRLIALSEAGGPIDWREMREQILAEHKKAPDESDRVLCLNLHHALLNFAERNAIEPHELEAFRENRYKDYIGLLLREAMIGETGDDLDPAKVLAITTREIRDGRMREDDELHKLAVDTVRKLGEPSPTKPSSLAAKLSSWFK